VRYLTLGMKRPYDEGMSELTADTITDEQIYRLMESAGGRGPTTAWCEEALGLALWQAGRKSRSARAVCADILNSLSNSRKVAP